MVVIESRFWWKDVNSSELMQGDPSIRVFGSLCVCLSDSHLTVISSNANIYIVCAEKLDSDQQHVNYCYGKLCPNQTAVFTRES